MKSERNRLIDKQNLAQNSSAVKSRKERKGGGPRTQSGSFSCLVIQPCHDPPRSRPRTARSQDLDQLAAATTRLQSCCSQQAPSKAAYCQAPKSCLASTRYEYTTLSPIYTPPCLPLHRNCNTTHRGGSVLKVLCCRGLRWVLSR